MSGYLHHIGPGPSCYSVHTFFALGLSCVLPLMRSRHSTTEYGWSLHYKPSTFYGDCPTHFRRQSVTGCMERGKRIELSASAWKAEVLPLYEPRNLYLTWCRHLDSNQGPLRYQHSALPTELWRQPYWNTG